MKVFFSFYQRIRKLKEGFVRFYFNKKFYDNYKKVESFIKGDDNLFYSASLLPGSFYGGMATSFLYIVALLGLLYFRFKAFFFYVPNKRMPELKKLNIELKSGHSEVVLTGDQMLKNQFYNVFSGESKEFDGTFMVDNVDIGKKKNGVNGDFLYLCHPQYIPEDMKTGNLVRLFQNLAGLSKNEKAELYVKLNMEAIEKRNFTELEEAVKGNLLWTVSLLKKRDIYMIDDFGKGMPANFLLPFTDGLRKLKEKGAAILYLTTDTLIVKKVGDSVTSLYDDPGLHNHLKTYRFLNEDSGKIPVTDVDKLVKG